MNSNHHNDDDNGDMSPAETTASSPLEIPVANGGEEEEENPSTNNKPTGYFLRWSRLTKTVTVTENGAGLMGRNSISSRNFQAKKQTSNGDVASSTAPGKTLKVILDEISGSAAPGQLTCCMGPSGAGKTSLMNVLAGRSSYQGGSISINGEVVTGQTMKRLMSKVAYVKQADIFFGHLAVRDHLTYNALLRLPSSLSTAEKHEAVHQILETLRLTQVADTAIRMLSGGEKKRVNIGSEILTSPPAILLDEPTSGLDSTSAVSLIKLLQSFARDQGKTVITTIHQPNSEVFFSFDRLILLSEGKSVFFGSPTDSLSYLRRLKMPCPDGYNAADYWMDLLVKDDNILSESLALEQTNGEHTNGEETTTTSGLRHRHDGSNKLPPPQAQQQQQHNTTKTQGRQSSRHILQEAWDNEAIAEQLDREVTKSQAQLVQNQAQKLESEMGKKYSTSWTTQYFILTHRALKNSRTAIFTTLNLLKSMALGLVCGMLWFDTEYTEKRLDDIRGYLFFTTVFWVFDSIFTSIMTFPAEREVILRERASGAYRLSAYFMAKTTSDAPVRLILPLIFMTISFWMGGFDSRFTTFLGLLGLILLSVLSGEALGLLVGATFTDFQEAITFTTVYMLFLMLLGGFYVESVPGWVDWAKYLSPFYYSFNGSVHLIFSRNVPCDGSGTLEEFCQGDDSEAVFVDYKDVRDFFGVEGSVGFNVGMLVLMCAVPRYVAYLGLRRQKAGERS